MFIYQNTLRIRISDINYGNHLGHVELINLLHEVRMQFLQEYGLSEIDMKGAVLIMQHLNVTYLKQAFWNNELAIGMTCKQQGVKMIFDYVIHNLTLHNKTAVAETHMVLIDQQKQKVIKPDLIMDLIKSGSKS